MLGRLRVEVLLGVLELQLVDLRVALPVADDRANVVQDQDAVVPWDLRRARLGKYARGLHDGQFDIVVRAGLPDEGLN